jgi:hypothetical protein
MERLLYSAIFGLFLLLAGSTALFCCARIWGMPMWAVVTAGVAWLVLASLMVLTRDTDLDPDSVADDA